MNAQANATLDLDIDMAVNLAYKITDGQLIFPPNAKLPGGGNFAPADARKFLTFGLIVVLIYDLSISIENISEPQCPSRGKTRGPCYSYCMPFLIASTNRINQSSCRLILV